MDSVPNKRELARQERRQEILDAALKVFGQKGYNAANVSDIAARAGVSQGTIYWYFESKEELFGAVLLSYLGSFGKGLDARLERCVTAADKLRVLGNEWVAFAQKVEGLFIRLLEFWATNAGSEVSSDVWIEALDEFKTLFVSIVQEGVNEGEFCPVDADAFALAVLAAYDGLAAYLVLLPDLELQRVSDAFIELIIRGLENPCTDRAAYGL